MALSVQADRSDAPSSKPAVLVLKVKSIKNDGRDAHSVLRECYMLAENLDIFRRVV